jgi:hypothetical protein
MTEPAAFLPHAQYEELEMDEVAPSSGEDVYEPLLNPPKPTSGTGISREAFACLLLQHASKYAVSDHSNLSDVIHCSTFNAGVYDFAIFLFCTPSLFGHRK